MYYESTGVVSSFATPLKSRLLNIIIEKIHKYIKKYPVLYKWFSILYNLYVLNENKDKVDGVEIIKEATKEIEKVDTCPFFLWLHFMDVHYRYNTPRNVFESTIGKKYPSLFRRASIFSKMRFARLSNKEREVLINLYESSIRYVDICIGILLRYLIRKNLLQETCIIITSDHGEEFNEHGSYGHFKPKLYNEMLRVPLIIYNGGYSRKIIYRLVSLIDLGPTILDILGIKCPTNFFGDSLIPLINNSSILIKPVISEYKNDKLSLIINRYKALYEADKSILDIYDLKVDPYERTPITDNKLKETFNTKIIEYLELRKNIKRNMLRKLLNTTKISMSSKKIENV
jgi:arylsulfatase A-like enzyme